MSRVSRSRGAGTYHHGDLRRALLDASLDLIAVHGPEGFTLRAAAKAAGVSDAAPYHHFADKGALLAAVAEEGFRALHEELSRVTAGLANPRARARALGCAYVVFAATHPSHFRVMVSRSLQNSADHPGLVEAAAAAFQLVQSCLLEAVAEDPRNPSTEHVIFGSWALVHGLAFLAIDGHLGPLGRDDERLAPFVEQVLALFGNDA